MSVQLPTVAKQLDRLCSVILFSSRLHIFVFPSTYHVQVSLSGHLKIESTAEHVSDVRLVRIVTWMYAVAEVNNQLYCVVHSRHFG